MARIASVGDAQIVLTRERKVLEILQAHNKPMTVDEIAAYASEPRSSTYKSIGRLYDTGVLIRGRTGSVTDTGRATTKATYMVDPERYRNITQSFEVVGELPKYYNQISKQLYSLLDLANRYEPERITGGVKAAGAYLEVATLLLSLALDPAGAESVENLKKQAVLRQYLQQAVPAVDNVRAQMQQMLDDHRLWTKDLYVLGANEQVRNNKDSIIKKTDTIYVPNYKD